jgi:hypothetical protein
MCRSGAVKFSIQSRHSGSAAFLRTSTSDRPPRTEAWSRRTRFLGWARNNRIASYSTDLSRNDFEHFAVIALVLRQSCIASRYECLSRTTAGSYDLPMTMPATKRLADTSEFMSVHGFRYRLVPRCLFAQISP